MLMMCLIFYYKEEQKMDENDIKNLKDLQFTITENMKNITIEMFTTKQMLDECELSKKDRKNDL